jgi:hypothetical protein
MLSPVQNAESVWRMLEEIYLDSVIKARQVAYARSSDRDKRAILMEFARRRAITSKRWQQILRELPIAALMS